MIPDQLLTTAYLTLIADKALYESKNKGRDQGQCSKNTR